MFFSAVPSNAARWQDTVRDSRLPMTSMKLTLPRTKQSIWTSLHSAEVFALAVAVAAVIQSAIFIGVQSTTLGSQWATECALTAQLVWPGNILGGLASHFLTMYSILACRLYDPRLQFGGHVSFFWKNPVPCQRDMDCSRVCRCHRFRNVWALACSLSF